MVQDIKLIFTYEFETHDIYQRYTCWSLARSSWLWMLSSTSGAFRVQMSAFLLKLLGSTTSPCPSFVSDSPDEGVCSELPSTNPMEQQSFPSSLWCHRWIVTVTMRRLYVVRCPGASIIFFANIDYAAWYRRCVLLQQCCTSRIPGTFCMSVSYYKLQYEWVFIFVVERWVHQQLGIYSRYVPGTSISNASLLDMYSYCTRRATFSCTWGPLTESQQVRSIPGNKISGHQVQQIYRIRKPVAWRIVS